MLNSIFGKTIGFENPMGTYIHEYTNSFSLEERITESNRICSKHPDKIPIILHFDKQIKFPCKKKILIDKTAYVSELIFFLRSKIQLKDNEALMIFCDNSILCGNQSLYHLYYDFISRENNDDKFLYIHVNIENTFGSSS